MIHGIVAIVSYMDIMKEASSMKLALNRRCDYDYRSIGGNKWDSYHS